MGNMCRKGRPSWQRMVNVELEGTGQTVSVLVYFKAPSQPLFSFHPLPLLVTRQHQSPLTDSSQIFSCSPHTSPAPSIMYSPMSDLFTGRLAGTSTSVKATFSVLSLTQTHAYCVQNCLVLTQCTHIIITQSRISSFIHNHPSSHICIVTNNC